MPLPVDQRASAGRRGFWPSIARIFVVEILGELDFAEGVANVLCLYGQVITGRMGRFGMVANPPLAFATNVAARGLSFVLRPITNSNFSAFTVNLWAECKK